ncbi:MAG: hypothetical protein IJ220_01850 [Clostridia bacterium]|nr:hypothetical protein [Clostridia bacterium]
MKKIFKVIIAMMMVFMLVGCGTTKNEITDNSNQIQNTENNTSEALENINSKSKVTAELAYEGINNYCHSEYDWSIAKDNPSIMYLEMGEETENEYQVVFRSYTGAIVYFYVDKATGITRMIEHVPSLEIEEEIGTINVYDYINKD